jgi:hypothetical protein
VLRVFFGLIFIEQRNDFAHHRLCGIIVIAERLGNGYQLDALLCQFAKIKLLAEGISKEAAIAVNGDDIERVVAVAGPFDHLLEHRSLVIGSGCGLDKFRDRLMALGFAPRQDLRLRSVPFSSQATIILLLSTALVLPLITSRNRWNCRSICASSMRCATNC